MSLTLKALAELAGVHSSTVARVLNADPNQRVSAEVRARILALAHEHGYQPNHVARSLRTKRSAVIGTLIPDIANPFFALMFRGIEDALSERGYSVILANTDDEYAREDRGITMLRGRQVDGLILATARRQDPAVQRLLGEGFPLVLVNRHTDPITPNAVIPADYAGSVTAVAHLVGLGHRRIAHIAGSDEMSTGHTRTLGYRDALDRHGIPFAPDLLIEGSYREPGGYEAMRRLLALPDPPTAVFAVNDLAAAGAIRAAHEAGLAVPDDVSIVGFNDLSTVAPTTPGLTTLQLPIHAMGMAAAGRLLAQILGSADAAQRASSDVLKIASPASGAAGSASRAAAIAFTEPVIQPVTLIVRGSTGPVPIHLKRGARRTALAERRPAREPDVAEPSLRE